MVQRVCRTQDPAQPGVFPNRERVELDEMESSPTRGNETAASGAEKKLKEKSESVLNEAR